MDYRAFIDGRKTVLVAPAGYGKTYTIAECLKYTDGRQLILTHTHAGVASIREKIKKLRIDSGKYRVETISSFAQKYSHAFYTGVDMPSQEDKGYHSFVIQKAKEIFASPTVERVISASYTGLFVDEYQDCSKGQHAMISVLSNTLPTHILGDPMQGIFDFNDDAVNLDSDLDNFEMLPELSIPYRWYQKGNNSGLGDLLKGYRELLKLGQPIPLVPNPDNGLYVVCVKADDFQNSQSRYRKGLDKLIRNSNNNPEYESLLIIVPEYEEIDSKGRRTPKGNINHRANIKAQIDYSKSLNLLEAIDDKSFYAIAKKADLLINNVIRANSKIMRVKKDVLERVFNKSDLDVWFNDIGLKSKKNEIEKNRSLVFQNRIDIFIGTPSAANLYEIILEAKDGLGLKLKYKREEIIFSFLRALKESRQSNISVYEAIKNSRNAIRRSGRKINGKCIGTTLLTKGLEFDTVVILDAHRFECPKHLYVALTRCCKKLIIFTERMTLLG